MSLASNARTYSMYVCIHYNYGGISRQNAPALTAIDRIVEKLRSIHRASEGGQAGGQIAMGC